MAHHRLAHSGDVVLDEMQLTSNKPKIYLAGSSVFDVDWDIQAAAMIAACARRGAIGLYPIDLEAVEPTADATAPHPDSFAASMAIFNRDRELIERADGVVADFSPFRGISADVGTVWEAGYAAGLGKPVAAFTLETRTYVQRREPHHRGAFRHSPIADNLMLTGATVWANPLFADALEESGGLCTSFEQALDMVLKALSDR